MLLETVRQGFVVAFRSRLPFSLHLSRWQPGIYSFPVQRAVWSADDRLQMPLLLLTRATQTRTI
jgi:hypothetical protein